jgi:hypothetical protein
MAYASAPRHAARASVECLDRYTAPNENFVPVVKSRVAVLGARSAPKIETNTSPRFALRATDGGAKQWV